MIKCNSCGKANPDGSAFCNQCGRSTSSSGNSNHTPKPRDKQSVELPSFIQDVVILRPNELVLKLWAGSKHSFVMVDGNKQSRTESGYLMVTDQRVFFIAKLGFFSESYSATDVIGLESIGGITVKPGFLNDLLIINYGQAANLSSLSVGSISEYDLDRFKPGRSVTLNDIRTMSTRSVSLQAIDKMLSELVQQRLHEVDEEKRKERVQFVLDFSFLRTEMEKGGVVLQTIKCPACGAGMSIPSAGTTTQCPYCGSMVHAHDVFEKMKGLISSI